MSSALFSQATEFVDAVAWPLALVTVVLVFRRHLVALLERDHVELSALGHFSVTASGRTAATKALVKATEKKSAGDVDAASAAGAVDAAAEGVANMRHRPQILWVDDNPAYNRLEIDALHALGMHVALSISTDSALRRLDEGREFDVVISDMGRPEGDRAGYDLLDRLRNRGVKTPVVFYTSSGEPEHFNEAIRRGASGSTNRPDELIQMVVNALWVTARSARV